MRVSPIYFLIICIFIGFGCQKENSVQAYYFPIDELLEEEKIYEYSDIKGIAPPYYWYYAGMKTEKGETHLVGKRFNHLYLPIQLTKESILTEGAIATEYRLYENDSVGNVKNIQFAKITNNILFPFVPVRDITKTYRFILSFDDFKDPTQTYLVTRDRQWWKKDTMSYKNKLYDTQIFRVLNTTEITRQDGGNWTLRDTSYEVYAQNIGMIHEKRKIREEIREVKLTNIYSIPEFEKIFKKNVKKISF